MWPISRQFRAALAGDHFVVSKVELLVEGEVVRDLSAEGVVADGTVNVDNAAVRRSGQISLIDGSSVLLPGTASDPLAPTGSELRIWRGILFADGTPAEYVPVGTLRFVVTEAAWPRIDLECYDRAWTIAGAGLEKTLTIAAGTGYIEAITAVLQGAWGGDLPTNFPTTDETTALMVFEAEADPWEVARELAGNIGMQLYFDPLGVAQMTPEPDAATDPPVWTFDEGDAQDLMLPGLRAVWDGTGNNAVIVIGENLDSGTPSRGAAFDLDPDSPTRYGGPFGKRPVYLRDEKVTNALQARLRAHKELRRRLGLSQTITIPTLVNPAWEVGDVAYCASARRKIDQLAILERFAVPLRASGTMLLEARARQVLV